MSSPARNAFRSMPAQKLPPAPVRTATDRAGSSSSSCTASASPKLTARLIALRACGRLIVMTSVRPRRSVEQLAQTLSPPGYPPPPNVASSAS